MWSVRVVEWLSTVVCAALTSLIEARTVVVRDWAAVVVLEDLGVEAVVLSGVEG